MRIALCGLLLGVVGCRTEPSKSPRYFTRHDHLLTALAKVCATERLEKETSDRSRGPTRNREGSLDCSLVSPYGEPTSVRVTWWGNSGAGTQGDAEICHLRVETLKGAVKDSSFLAQLFVDRDLGARLATHATGGTTAVVEGISVGRRGEMLDVDACTDPLKPPQ